MSRNSPTGFAFSIVLEIAAVVGIVSLLPRFDLRPSGSASADQTPPPPAEAVLPLEWTNPGRHDEIAARPSSFYARQAPIQPAELQPAPFQQAPSREAPPLIEIEANRPQYVEQRLDRASQTLVNSLGAAVTDAADNWRRYQPAPTSNAPQPRPRVSQQPTQPKPWIRY